MKNLPRQTPLHRKPFTNLTMIYDFYTLDSAVVPLKPNPLAAKSDTYS